jgi:hypothetical protein
LYVLGNCGKSLQRSVLGEENNLGAANFIDSSGRVAVEIRPHKFWKVLAVEVCENAK